MKIIICVIAVLFGLIFICASQENVKPPKLRIGHKLAAGHNVVVNHQLQKMREAKNQKLDSRNSLIARAEVEAVVKNLNITEEVKEKAAEILEQKGTIADLIPEVQEGEDIVNAERTIQEWFHSQIFILISGILLATTIFCCICATVAQLQLRSLFNV